MHELFYEIIKGGLISEKISPWFKSHKNRCQNTVLSTIYLKFILFKKAMKIDEIFTVDLTLCSNCQIYGEDFVDFCGLLRKHELYFFEVHKMSTELII